MTRRSRILCGFGIWLIGFAAVGLPKAMWRHFHVDEFQIAYNIALWGVHDLPNYTNYAAPYMVPLGRLIRGLDTSADMLLALRLVFLGVFSLILIACAWAQPYFRSAWGRVCVLIAVTCFHPLWLNGFEIRHDTIVVLGSILLYGFAQRAAASRASSWTFVAGGVISATMQTNSIKAAVYWPVFGAVLVGLGTRAVWSDRTWQRARPAASFLGGLLLGVVLNLGVLVLDGRLAVYVSGLAAFMNNLGNSERFTPTTELLRLALDSPVVFGFAFVASVLVVADAARGIGTIRSTITVGFMAWTVVTLYINPVPFPYNHLYELPFVAFAALDAAHRVQLTARRSAVIAGAGLAAAMLLVFTRAWLTDPFLTRTNVAQLSYIDAAEMLTGPDDTILDGAGLVLTRRPPHKHWMIHSQFLAEYYSGQRTSFAEIIASCTSPVILDNYRWAWLSPSDLSARDAWYVRVAPRLFVLGRHLDPGGGEFIIHHSGRYRVAVSDPIHERVRIDGDFLPQDGAMQLRTGAHAYESVGAKGADLLWMGPKLGTDEALRIPSLGSGEEFFTNEPRHLVL